MFSLALALGLALPGFAAEGSALRFTDATVESGLRFTLTSGEIPSREIVEVNGGGVAFVDYDGDGDHDIFLANGATMQDPERGPGSRLYANDGRGRFSDVTKRVGIALRRWANGVAIGDYDNDGDDDIYVTCFGPNVLLRNDVLDGNRRFVDATRVAGVGDARWGASAAFGDVDGDGDLDLFVTNYVEFDIKNLPARKMFKGAPIFAGPAGMSAPGNVLYENIGGGKFRDRSGKSGIAVSRAGYSMGVMILDVDGDGRQDIYVGNDSTANFLFHNQGQGKFAEVGVIFGVASNYDG